jgi:hypothetical protein
MYNDLYTTERLVQQHRKDMLREAEQERLVRTVERPRKVPGLRRRVVFMLTSLLALLTRLQS